MLSAVPDPVGIPGDNTSDGKRCSSIGSIIKSGSISEFSSVCHHRAINATYQHIRRFTRSPAHCSHCCALSDIAAGDACISAAKYCAGHGTVEEPVPHTGDL